MVSGGRAGAATDGGLLNTGAPPQSAAVAPWPSLVSRDPRTGTSDNHTLPSLRSLPLRCRNTEGYQYNTHMTLIITALSPDKVMQVSDRRLTYASGKTATDAANKAVTVWCDDAYFSVAYTGLAHIYDKESRLRKRTDKWIAHSLWSIMQRPGSWGVRDLYRTFAVHAEEALELTRNVPLTNRGTAFVFAGFFYRSTPIAFVGTLSNMKAPPRGGIKVIRQFDTQRVWSLNPAMPVNEVEIQVDGTEAALFSRDAIAKAINRRTRVIHRRLERMESGAPLRSREEVAGELVHIVRMATHHPDYGKYIGRDCMAVSCRPHNLGFFADTYKEKSIEHNTPIMVTRDIVAESSWSITQEPPPAGT